MAKVHILGGPGSGKTTLAQNLSSRLHIPHYDLDKVDWEKENVIAIAEQAAWITEGIYLIFTEPLLYHADCIVLLTASWPVAAWRMIRRHVLNSLCGTQSYPGINGVKALIKLMKDARRYYLNQDNIDSVDRLSIETLSMYRETYRELAVPPTEEFVQQYFEAYEELAVPPTEEFVQQYLETYKEKVVLIKNDADRERLFELLAKQR